MKEFFKKHYMKILIVLFAILYFNACTKSCSKNIELNIVKIELDSVYTANKTVNDSLLYLNNTIKLKDVEIENKNKQIEQLSTTLNTVLKKNTTNNIRVIVPEQKNEIKNE